MTLKYESEILFDLMKRDGDDTPSDVLPYESELKEKYLHQVEGAYPKLQDYRSEWLNYNLMAHLPADFPVETLSNVTEATVDNVVPYAYRSAILKGSTKYRDIDTGEILETFEEGRNLELVSVKMPVLTTSNTVELLKSNNFPLIGIGSSNKHSFLLSKTVDVITLFANLKTVSAYNPDANISFIFKLDDVVKKTVYQKLTPLGITSDIKIIVTGISFNLVEIMVPPATTLDINTMNVFHGEFNEKPLIKSNILSTPEDVTLRGIGEVQDTLDCLTGELTQRIGEVVYTEKEDWYHYLDNEFDDSILFSCTSLKIGDVNDSSMKINFISDTFTPSHQIYTQNIIGSYIQNGCLFIRVKKEWLTTPDVYGLKQYLQVNPFTIQFPLETESVKTVDLTVTDQDGNTSSIIRPIEGTLHLMTEGDTIKPLFSGEIPVEAITQNLASFIEE